MKSRKFNIIVAVAGFILGAAYVLSDSAGINANVVGYSGSGAALTTIMGVVIIIVSAVFFLEATHLNHDTELERMVRFTPQNHEEIKKAVKEQEMKEEYDDKKQ